LCIIMLFVSMAYYAMIPVASKVATSIFEHDPTSAAEYSTIVTSISKVLQIIASPVLGMLSDTWGRKLILVESITISGFCILATANASTPFQLLFPQVLRGMVDATKPTIYAILVDLCMMHPGEYPHIYKKPAGKRKGSRANPPKKQKRKEERNKRKRAGKRLKSTEYYQESGLERAPHDDVQLLEGDNDVSNDAKEWPWNFKRSESSSSSIATIDASRSTDASSPRHEEALSDRASGTASPVSLEEGNYDVKTGQVVWSNSNSSSPRMQMRKETCPGWTRLEAIEQARLHRLFWFGTIGVIESIGLGLGPIVGTVMITQSGMKSTVTVIGLLYLAVGTAVCLLPLETTEMKYARNGLMNPNTKIAQCPGPQDDPHLSLGQSPDYRNHQKAVGMCPNISVLWGHSDDDLGPCVSTALVPFCLNIVALSSLNMWYVYTADRLGWTSIQSSFFVGAYALFAILGKGLVLRSMVPNVHPAHQTNVISVCALAAMFFGFGAGTTTAALYMTLPLNILGCLTIPLTRSRLSGLAGPSGQGSLQGLLQSINSAASLLGSFLAVLFFIPLDSIPVDEISSVWEELDLLIIRGGPYFFASAVLLVAALLLTCCVTSKAQRVGTAKKQSDYNANSHNEYYNDEPRATGVVFI